MVNCKWLLGGFFLIPLFLSSCQETLEERAARQAKEYTERYCPTPVINYSRTDSVVFDRKRNVYIYYLSFCDLLDDQKIIEENRDKITDMLTQSVRESTGLKNFIEAGFKFEYVCHSEKEPKKVLFKISI
jgi:hypothetical protein